MANPKDILVSTTSSVEGLKVKKYLKPVSAHVVAGTNMFSDFFAGWTDILGGQSETYQKQLNSLYIEAIRRVKYAAYEIGANCIIGLSIDMDEISGKGKSMFMLTAVGTAIILEKEVVEKANLPQVDEKLERVAVDRIHALKKKKEIIAKANAGTLKFNEDMWNFITSNQIHEVFPNLIKQYKEVIFNDFNSPGGSERFHMQLVGYMNALPEAIKLNLLYKALIEEDSQITPQVAEIIKKLNLFDFKRSMFLLKHEDFQVQKLGIRVVTYDKLFYDKQDTIDLQRIIEHIQSSFPVRGVPATKKQFLAFKEKEVWICECGKTNDKDTNCIGCEQDLYGFKPYEIKPSTAIKLLKQKISLITEYLK